MATRSRSEITVVQQLRGIAAMLVVYYHANAQASWLFLPIKGLYFGQAGVDIFFLISGIVMFIAARHERVGEFWFKRIIRIVPLYWLTTLLLFAIQFRHYGDPGVSIGALVKSLLFIPYSLAPGGPVWPMLVPGWTLNIEMFFYVLFGIGLVVGRPALFAAAMIVAIVAGGLMFKPETAALVLYSRPIILEFAIGLGIGALYLRGRCPAALWPLVPIGLVILIGSDSAGAHAALTRGAGAVLTMFGALCLEARVRVRTHPLIKAIGDSSYSLYLVHVILLQGLRAVFQHVPLTGWPQYLLFMATALGLCGLVGWLVHIGIEKPLLRWVRSRRRTEPLTPRVKEKVDAGVAA